jgi:hypothetical protein
VGRLHRLQKSTPENIEPLIIFIGTLPPMHRCTHVWSSSGELGGMAVHSEAMQLPIAPSRMLLLQSMRMDMCKELRSFARGLTRITPLGRAGRLAHLVRQRAGSVGGRRAVCCTRGLLILLFLMFKTLPVSARGATHSCR